MNIKPSLNPFLRYSRFCAGLFIDKLLLVDHLLSSNKIQVRKVYSYRFKEVESANLIVFARYSRQGSLTTNEWDTLRFLANQDCDLVLVSNSNLDTNELLKLKQELNVTVIVRKNKGRDFGAFRDALEILSPLDRYSSLLLINNSIFWEISKLGTLLEAQAGSMNADIVGLTESFQKSHHLQSYFLLFQGKYWESFLKEEINSWKNWRFKRSIVEFGERGMSKRARRKNLRLRAVFQYSQLIADSVDVGYLADLIRLGVKLNPTQHLWEALHARAFPGVKMSLLDSNPANLPKLPLDPRT